MTDSKLTVSTAAVTKRRRLTLCGPFSIFRRRSTVRRSFQIARKTENVEITFARLSQWKIIAANLLLTSHRVGYVDGSQNGLLLLGQHLSHSKFVPLVEMKAPIGDDERQKEGATCK